jgi:TetR/AcrR family transcriptional regulator
VSRDAARSREAILDAAERMFAERGFGAVTLQQIGEAAGLSRGTPGYFFGSKEKLYRAVLARVRAARDEAVREALAPLRDWAEKDPAPSPRRRRAALAAALDAGIDGYLRFLQERPSFARLVAWESLHGGKRLEGGADDAGAIAHTLRGVHARRGELGLRDFDPVLVSIAFVSLCFLPVAHAATFARMSDINTATPEFGEAYRAQVLDSILHSLTG